MFHTSLSNLPPIAEIGNGCFLSRTFSNSQNPDKTTVSLTIRKMTDKLHPSTDISDLSEILSGVVTNKSGNDFYETNLTAKDIMAHDKNSFGMDWENKIPKYVMRLNRMSFEKHLQLKNLFPLDNYFYWGYQPLCVPLIYDLELFLYLPFGTNTDLLMVVVENGCSKQTLEMQLKDRTDPMEFTSSWNVFYEKSKDCTIQQQCFPCESQVPLTLFNVAKKDDKLHLYKCSFDFNWPRMLMTVCSTCSAETNGSQLCGGGFCLSENAISHLPEFEAKKSLENLIQEHEAEQKSMELYHTSYEKIETEFLGLDIFGNKNEMNVEMIMHDRDYYILTIGKHIYEISCIVGQIDCIYESTFSKKNLVACKSPFLSNLGYFHYVTKAGHLVTVNVSETVKERALIANFVPKNAIETAKLFFLDDKLVCYYFVNQSHFVLNISQSMITDI